MVMEAIQNLRMVNTYDVFNNSFLSNSYSAEHFLFNKHTISFYYVKLRGPATLQDKTTQNYCLPSHKYPAKNKKHNTTR